MIKTRSLLGSLAVCALLGSMSASAFAQGDGSQPIPIEGAEGISWQLAEQIVDGTMAPVPADVVVTLLLEDGQAVGNGGCNSYFASYTIDTSALTFGEIGATMMFCEGAAGEVESTYFGNLAEVATWANTGGSLVLGGADGNPILNFLPAATEPVDSIEGIDWLLTGQAVDGQLTPLPAGGAGPIVVSLRLQDGQASGTGGCNRYFAGYTLDGLSLTFGPVGATEMFCEGAAGEVETAYFANLASVASWSSDGASLSLADANGVPILEYEAAPEASILGGWVASGVNNGNDAVVTSETTPSVTAIFQEDGSLTGFDGCNDYSTTYELLDGGGISISDAIATTRMACASDALSEQVAQYQKALVSATSWAVDVRGGLELRDDSGALQVSFTPAAG
jgi:heat shock protein HslJ